jgi:hypothetical protein
MFATSNQDDEVVTADEPLQGGSLFGYSVPLFPDGEWLGSPIEGTIGASMESADDPHFYGRRSETLIRGTPVGKERSGLEPFPRQLRARDLIAELHAINAQIHQIMFQVDRAVSRLATSG